MNAIRQVSARITTEGVCQVETSVRDSIAEMLPRIREEAARTEAERRIPTEVLAALMDAGVFSLTPDSDRATHTRGLLDVVRQVAGACGSTGWVTAHSGSVPWLLDVLPSEARRRLRGEQNVDPLVAFTVEPGGRVIPDTDGLRLEGHWSTVTGAAHASWLVLAARMRDDHTPGRVGLVLVEASECRLDEGPDRIGLTASGAQDVTATGLTIPADAWAEVSEQAASLAPVGAAVAMALVGAAQGALEVHLEQVGSRLALSHGGEDITASDPSPAHIARASSSLDAAALILLTQGDRETDPDAEPRDPFEDQLYAVERASEATRLILASARRHALDNDDPVARLWRDVQVGTHHARALIMRLRALGA